MAEKETRDTELLAEWERGAFLALRVPWDLLDLREWGKEVEMGFLDSQAAKVVKASQERGDHLAHQALKALLGDGDQKEPENQEPLEPQASLGFQEQRVTLGLLELLGPQGPRALGNQAYQAQRDKEDLLAYQEAQVPKGNKAQ